MGELHARLLAELDRRERELPALYHEPGTLVAVDSCTCYGGTLPQGHEPGCGTEQGPLWFALDELRRYYARDRRVLERHQALPDPVDTPIGPLTVCRICSDLDEDPIRVVGFPCWETLDLADALGVPVDGDQR